MPRFFSKNLLAVILFLLVAAVFADEELEMSQELEWEAEPVNELRRGDFWVGFGGDAAMYSQAGYAFGGSFALGYGKRTSIGFKAAWYFINEDNIDTIELNLLLRFYFFRAGYHGPFVQLMGGPSLYNRTGTFSLPATSGMISAGLSIGWRFVLFNRWYIEPSIRGGYPYMLGATVATGVRF
ncbi:MAG: DUF3575 domain-containing protein [Treponema sp.]|nr:DUF3575 domain-containing protein [Treponema sp.]